LIPGEHRIRILGRMREVIQDIDTWLSAGESNILLATVLSTWGSAPRKTGAKMAFTPGGRAISGSVSGGCVEGAVIASGDDVLKNGRPALLRFGVADETAWGVGLACGGTIEVFIERLDLSTYRLVSDWVATGERGIIITVIDGPDELTGKKVALTKDSPLAGNLSPELDRSIRRSVQETSQSGLLLLAEGVTIFVDVVQPPLELVIVGGAHIAVVLAQLAKILGYQITLIDPRRAFGSRERFAGVDRLIQSWPDKALAENPLKAQSAVVTLSHDPKIDDPALRAALVSDAFYIGALGSRKTHAKRCQRLAEMGFSSDQLARIHAPIGLDIGAENPEEIALAIVSQIVAAYRGRLQPATV
jgi:xanthine dehydrogenase accessory factor